MFNWLPYFHQQVRIAGEGWLTDSTYEAKNIPMFIYVCLSIICALEIKNIEYNDYEIVMRKSKS